MSKIKIGARLKELREARGLSQYDVEREIGILQKTVSSYENNHNVPPLDVLKKLAEYYQTSIDYIVYGNYSRCEDKKMGYDKLLNYIYKVKEISVKDRKLIETLLGRILFTIEKDKDYNSYVKNM